MNRRQTGASGACSCSSPACARVENKQDDVPDAPVTRLTSGNANPPQPGPARPPPRCCRRCGATEDGCESKRTFRATRCCETCDHVRDAVRDHVQEDGMTMSATTSTSTATATATDDSTTARPPLLVETAVSARGAMPTRSPRLPPEGSPPGVAAYDQRATPGAAGADRGPECTSCSGSADGCRARLAARFGRCCRLCSHGPTKKVPSTTEGA